MDVSSDGGISWLRIGSVTKPATAAGSSSKLLSIAEPASVAGAAPNYLLVHLGAAADRAASLRIGAAGHPETASAAITDIAPSSPLFRSIAPPPGSRFRLVRDGALTDPPTGYTPRLDDMWVMLVDLAPEGSVSTLTIENSPGGSAVFQVTGGLPRLVGKVRQPLRGIGRYAGTELGSAGDLLMWTPVTILVSTSGGGSEAGVEKRGGFIIQPAEPALEGATHAASQVLIEAVASEGGPPIAALFGLPLPLSGSDALDVARPRVEIRVDGGEWRAMPALAGPISEDGFPAALRSALSAAAPIERGITHFRLIAPAPSKEALARRLLLAAATPVGEPQIGIVTVAANVTDAEVAYVRFKLDGEQTLLTNLPPFNWRWDTTSVPNGEHLIEIEGLNKSLAVVSRASARVRVENPPK